MLEQTLPNKIDPIFFVLVFPISRMYPESHGHNLHFIIFSFILCNDKSSFANTILGIPY
jgi:hypothetical protein